MMVNYSKSLLTKCESKSFNKKKEFQCLELRFHKRTNIRDLQSKHVDLLLEASWDMRTWQAGAKWGLVYRSWHHSLYLLFRIHACKCWLCLSPSVLREPLPFFHLSLSMPLTPAHHSLVWLRMVLVCIYCFMLGGMRAIGWLCASRSFGSSVQDTLPCSGLPLLLPC